MATPDETPSLKVYTYDELMEYIVSTKYTDFNDIMDDVYETVRVLEEEQGIDPAEIFLLFGTWNDNLHGRPHVWKAIYKSYKVEDRLRDSLNAIASKRKDNS